MRSRESVITGGDLPNLLSLAMICGIFLRRRLSAGSAITGEDLPNLPSPATIY
jgi:hypothetical protein